MTYRAHYDEARIAKLLKALPPAPPAWVEAAQELPSANRAMDGMVARAEATQQFQAEVAADLDQIDVAEPRTYGILHGMNEKPAPGGTK
jgi:hypothetical protein